MLRNVSSYQNNQHFWGGRKGSWRWSWRQELGLWCCWGDVCVLHILLQMCFDTGSTTGSEFFVFLRLAAWILWWSHLQLSLQRLLQLWRRSQRFSWLLPSAKRRLTRPVRRRTRNRRRPPKKLALQNFKGKLSLGILSKSFCLSSLWFISAALEINVI